VKKSVRRAAAISVAAATLTAVGVIPAHAAFPTEHDPSGKLVNIFGSNTTQDVFNALTTGYTLGTTTYTADSVGATFGSWNATNPSTGAIDDLITPVSGGDTFERPDGSGDGRNALSAANNTAKNTWVSADSGDTNTLTAGATVKAEEVSFSRSSSLPGFANWKQNNAANTQLTFIPQAKDAVGVAEVPATTGGNTVGNFIEDTTAPAGSATAGALTAIYSGSTFTQNAGTNTVGDVIETGGHPFVVTGVHGGVVTASQEVVGVLPQASSGTRGFFLNAIGVSSPNLSVVANETGSVAQEENNSAKDLSTTNINAAFAAQGSSFTVPSGADVIVPFSGAQAVEQNHFSTISTLTNNPIFPTLNNLTLTNGLSGASASTGTLQNGTPNTTFNGNLVGNFARFVWAALPSTIVTTSPTSEGTIQKWVDQTTQATGGAVQQLWTDFGFKEVGSTFADNSSNWVITKFLN
jgi:hypothetical protein